MLPYLCFAGKETSLRVKDILSLGLGLCTQTLRPTVGSLGVLLRGRGRLMPGVAQKEDNCQGAEVRGCQKLLSPIPVSWHTLRGQPDQDVACDSPACWTDLPALVCLY